MVLGVSGSGYPLGLGFILRADALSPIDKSASQPPQMPHAKIAASFSRVRKPRSSLLVNAPWL